MTLFVSILQLVIVTFIVARMVIVGWLQPPGKILSWPMFTRGVYVLTELRTSDGEPFDIYALRSEHLAAMSLPEFEAALSFARNTLNLKLNGSALVLHAHGSSKLMVVDSHVVS